MTDDILDQDQLRDLAARTAQLPRAIDPPADAWAVIEAAIQSPTATMAHSSISPAPRVATIPRAGTSAAFWQRPAFLAAAALLLVAGSSAITAIAIGRRSTVDATQAVASSSVAETATLPASSPSVVASTEVSGPGGTSDSANQDRVPVRRDEPRPSSTPAAGSTILASSETASALAEFTIRENDYIGTVNRLSAILESEQMQLSPRTLAKMKESIRVIDAAILEARRALAEDPANKQLVEMLSTTYTQKIDFLRRTTEMGRS